MFPLNDIVLIEEYSLDEMAFGERTVEKISPSMAEPFQLIEHEMCEESPKKKKKTEDISKTSDIVEKKNDAPPKEKQNTDDHKGELEEKPTVFSSITSYISFLPRLFDY